MLLNFALAKRWNSIYQSYCCQGLQFVFSVQWHMLRQHDHSYSQAPPPPWNESCNFNIIFIVLSSYLWWRTSKSCAIWFFKSLNDPPLNIEITNLITFYFCFKLFHQCCISFVGFMASTATNPIWFVKTRMQLDQK